MQLLYGNDGTNYRMIDRSSEMTDGIQKTLLEFYSKYDFVSHPEKYSSVTKEPEAITFVTTNLENQLSSNHLMICKTGHMSQYASPSYYFHVLLKDVTEEFFKEKFFEIFNYQFIVDRDVNSYKNGRIDRYRFTQDPFQGSGLSKDQLIVILATFMSNESSGRKTKIIVDQTGDQYNIRSREILASIYRYLPYKLRERYGFKTYSQDERSIPAGVSFVLFDQQEAKYNNDYITLWDSVSDLRVRKEYMEYATYLVSELDDAGRKKHFEDLSRLAKNGRLSVQDCITYYSKRKKWSMGTQEQMMSEWIKYIDQHSFRKGPLYELLLEVISEKVDNAYYNDYLFDQILRLYHVSIYSLTEEASRTIRFADCLEEIYIMPERFHKWYEGQFKVKLNGLEDKDMKSVQQIQQIYKEEIATLQKINIMSDELDELLKYEIEKLKEEQEKYTDRLDQLQEEEATHLGEEIDSSKITSIDQCIARTETLLRTIQFEENKEILKCNVSEWLEAHFQQKFLNKDELDSYRDRVERLKQYISCETWRRYEEILNREEERLEKERQAMIFQIRNGAVLSNYIQLDKNMENGILKPDDQLDVTLGSRREFIRASSLKNLLQFLLEENTESCQQLMNSGIDLEVLIKADLLSVEHFEYLIKYIKQQEVLLLVQYYLEEDLSIQRSSRISGGHVANLIKEYCPDIMEELIRKYEDSEVSEARILVDHLKTSRGFGAMAQTIVNSPEAEAETGKKSASRKRFGFGSIFGGKK